MHLTGPRDIDREAAAQRAAFIAFDLLRDGADDLRPLPLTDRRARLERLFGASGSSDVRHGEFAAGDGRRLYRQATQNGWEGLVAKLAESRYESGRRSPAWRKLKILSEREFIIGGWTAPRSTRQYFGALLLGALRSRPQGEGRGLASDAAARLRRACRHRVHGEGAGASVRAARARAKPTRVRSASCRRPTKRPHWVRPELVAQVRFTEWTNERLLRHPVYLGLRDDVDAKTVTLEEPGADKPAAPREDAAATRAAASEPKKGSRRSAEAVAAATGPAKGGTRRVARAPAEAGVPHRAGRRAACARRARRSALRARSREARRDAHAARRLDARRHQSRQSLLACRRADQRRSAALLRPSIPVAAARRRRSPADHEAVSQRREGQGVLSAARAGRCRPRACGSNGWRTTASRTA